MCRTFLYLFLELFIFKRYCGSIDKTVPKDTDPSLPSLIILKKHFRLSSFNTPGQMNIMPIDKPEKKNKPYTNLL